MNKKKYFLRQYLYACLVAITSLLFLCGVAVSSDSTELNELKIQLELKQGLLGKVSEGIANMKANPRYCGGKPMTLEIHGDPEGQLRQEIAELENQIRILEEKKRLSDQKSEDKKWKETQKKLQGKVYKIKKKNDWWEKLFAKKK